jgi:hypothetical protein
MLFFRFGSTGGKVVKRREFMTLLGGAVAWPLGARAQQPRERMRRIGVIHTRNPRRSGIAGADEVIE